ncbi:MAG: FMN-binding protein [Myxococcales bacterium]|nr:FMN-binding protein [Myxococcales bacterium]
MKRARIAVLFFALASPVASRAASTYFTTPQILREFFPQSERVTYRKVSLTPAQQLAVSSRLGYRLPRSEYVVFLAFTRSQLDGYAIIDEERGQHEPITFAVKLSPHGAVERQEVMVYREAYGHEIVDPRFKRQFEGKSSRDEIRAGVDVDVVTGATISSRSMAIGVRRSVVLLEELVLKPAASTSAAKSALPKSG